MDTIREAVSHQGRDPVVVQLGKRLRGLGAGEDEPFMGMGNMVRGHLVRHSGSLEHF